MLGPVLAASAAVVLFVKKGDVADWLHVSIAKGRKHQPGKPFLSNNYAPVRDEVFAEGLTVEGELPAELDGIYLRNGPNPFYDPYAGYHWFDGDGMLHACRIKDGKASFCNRYVDTHKLQQEKKAGRPLFAKFGDQSGLRGLAVVLLHKLKCAWGKVDVSQGEGTGNTALTFHAGKLLALHEGDLPYTIRVLCSGVLETAGRMALPGWRQPFTAHPKLDAATGELFFFGYNPEQAPYLTLGVLGPKGDLLRCLEVDLPWPVMMHDMALSKSYMVLLHLPLVFEPEAMVKEGKLPLKYRKDKPARIGLLPREATSAEQIQWFELPALMCFHTAAALEDPATGKVRLFCCTFEDFDINLEAPNQDMRQSFSCVELDPATGQASRRVVCPGLLGDFPVTHPGMVGGNPRWAYMAKIDERSLVEFDGIAKIDMHAGADLADAWVGKVQLPEGCYGGEAVFVPRGSDAAAAEDDGFLLVYVYHSKEDVSKLHVYDAASMSSTPLATVALPQRVPYGFHGMWVSREQMQQQRVEV